MGKSSEMCHKCVVKRAELAGRNMDVDKEIAIGCRQRGVRPRARDFASRGGCRKSGYDTGNLGQCYTYGYLYSTTARLTTYYWKNFGLTYWLDDYNTYHSQVVPTPTWWAIEWDYSHVSSGATCNS